MQRGNIENTDGTDWTDIHGFDSAQKLIHENLCQSVSLMSLSSTRGKYQIGRKYMQQYSLPAKGQYREHGF